MIQGKVTRFTIIGLSTFHRHQMSKSQKRILESFYRVSVVSHLDPTWYVRPVNLKYASENEPNKREKEPQEYLRLKAIRKVRNLILTYWNFVIADTVAGKMKDDFDLSPWSK